MAAAAESPPESVDFAVRAAVYDGAIGSGAVPTSAQLAERLALQRSRVHESLERLAAAKTLVLQLESREILMASPFSAVPTPFAVRAAGRRYYGNCVWDALGIPAMLGADAEIEASCGCCGEAMRLAVAGGELESVAGVVHFAIPAARWWQDIVYN
ncbi:MAG: organomercurial lyase [Myxococcota bacterium]